MTGTATHRPLAEPFSTGASWLLRAIAVSFALHVVVAFAWWLAIKPRDSEVQLVDIELAPPPPKAEALPAEVARQAEQQAAAAAAAAEELPGEDELAVVDAGIDAPVDAPIDAPIDAPRKKKKPDAGVDAEMMVAGADDAGVGDAGDGDAAQIAMVDQAAGSAAEGAGSGSQDTPGTAGATQTDQGSGVPGMDTQPAVDGAPTSAGTAANLLAYFPPGHQITVLIRFDRLRKTEWAKPATQLFKPMPDYAALFGTKDVPIADQLDMLVISSPRPRDATATTLVGKTQMTRAQMRDFLANPTAPIEWSGTKGGMFGKRTGKLFPNDKRVLLSPWRGWFVLAQPPDVAGLTGAAKGDLDKIEARAKLPPWLATIRTIEDETNEPVTKPAAPGAPATTVKPKPGDNSKPDPTRGPALVLTLKGPGKRVTFPDIGDGITSAPSPERLTLAMELVKQGWLVRGNIVFASEADATEFVKSAGKLQQSITGNRIYAGLLKKQHIFNAVAGLSLARTGARVSYGTSISIADAHALLAAAAATLDAYFANPP